MSVCALKWCKGRGGDGTAQLVLFALAEHADDYGVTYVGQDTVASECCLTRQTVNKAMRRLHDLGLLGRIRRGRGGHRTSDMIVLAPKQADRGSMLDADATAFEKYPANVCELAQRRRAQRQEPMSISDSQCRGERHWPMSLSDRANVAFRQSQCRGERQEPPEEPPDNHQIVEKRASASAGVRVRVKGKPVDGEAWARTERILAEFNAQTDRHLRLMTSGGEPSEATKRIYMRVREYPDLSFDDHARIIRNTLASRWWLRGGLDDGEKPPIGVVYGPNVFEQNISRKAALKSVATSHAARVEEARAAGFAAYQRMKAEREAS